MQAAYSLNGRQSANTHPAQPETIKELIFNNEFKTAEEIAAAEKSPEYGIGTTIIVLVTVIIILVIVIIWLFVRNNQSEEYMLKQQLLNNPHRLLQQAQAQAQALNAQLQVPQQTAPMPTSAQVPQVASTQSAPAQQAAPTQQSSDLDNVPHPAKQFNATDLLNSATKSIADITLASATRANAPSATAQSGADPLKAAHEFQQQFADVDLEDTE